MIVVSASNALLTALRIHFDIHAQVLQKRISEELFNIVNFCVLIAIRIVILIMVRAITII